MLRAAGDNDGADDLLLELNETEIDETSDDPSVIVVEVESAGGESGEGVVTSAPPAAGETEVIAAAADAQVAVIEAQAAAEIAVMEAAAEIASAEREDSTDVVVVADATTDPEPDPEPRTTHWFYRPLGRSRD